MKATAWSRVFSTTAASEATADMPMEAVCHFSEGSRLFKIVFPRFQTGTGHVKVGPGEDQISAFDVVVAGEANQGGDGAVVL